MTDPGVFNSAVHPTILKKQFETSNNSCDDLAAKKLPFANVTQRYLHEHTFLGKKMAIITCPNCLMSIETDVRYVGTGMTHVAAMCLLPLGLCAIPYYTSHFQNSEHYCPMCKVYLGTSFAEGCTSPKCCAAESTELLDI